MPGFFRRLSGAFGRVGRMLRWRRPEGKLAAPALAELREPECRDVADLAEQMRRDYQVQLAELVLVANVKAARVNIAARGNDPRAQRLAAQLQRLWDETLASMTAAIGEGRVAYEKVWDYDPDVNLSIVRKLEALPFRQTSMRLTATGEFDGIDLTGKEETLTIPPEKSWWLALDPTPGEPHGRSRYVGAPQEVWRERREAIRLRKLFLKRFVVRAGVAHIPPTLEDERGELIDNFEATGKAIDELLAGGMLLFPNTRDAQGNYEYEYHDPPSTLDPTPIDTVIDGLDAEQLRAFGVPEKTVIEGQAVGSFALVSQQMLILYAVVEGLLRQFLESFQKYVIDKVVEANFEPHAAPCISASFTPLTQQPNSLLVELVKTLLTAPQLGPLVSSGGINLQQMLEEAGIPVTEDVAARLSQALAQAAMAAGESAEGSAGTSMQAPPDDGFAIDLNCGTGKGGFQRGNDCAKGRRGGGGNSSRRESRKRKSGANRERADTAEDDHGSAGSKRKSPSRKNARDPASNGGEAEVDPQRSLRSQRAKDSYVEVTPEKRARARESEIRVANELAGTHFGGRHPVDVVLDLKGVEHGIEVKTMFENSSDHITMRGRSRQRKFDWENTNPPPRLVHTVVFDTREDPPVIYYRRGFGNFSVKSMHKVKDIRDLKKLLAMNDRDLPKAAKFVPGPRNSGY